jgi:hypothetical protein
MKVAKILISLSVKIVLCFNWKGISLQKNKKAHIILKVNTEQTL